MLGATLFVGCYSVRWMLLSSDFAAELASLAIGPGPWALGPGTRAPFFNHSSVGGLCSMLGATLFVGCYYLLISRRSSLRSQMGPGPGPWAWDQGPGSLFLNHSSVGGLRSMLCATLFVRRYSVRWVLLSPLGATIF